MATEEVVTVRGAPVKSLLSFIERELTAEQRARAFATLPAEYAERWSSGSTDHSAPVPVFVLNRLTEEAARAKGEPVETFAPRAGRSAAEDAITGIYRFFAGALTPTALLNKASQMWSTLYNKGELQVESQTSTGARIKIADLQMESAACLRMTGWIEQMAELSGVRNPRIDQVRCSSRGAPACEWEISWD